MTDGGPEPRRGGYIFWWRCIRDHWTSDRPDWAQAWLDLVLSAEWRDAERESHGQVITVPRGSLLASERFLWRRWQHWHFYAGNEKVKCFTLKAVRVFLRRLEKDKMIRRRQIGSRNTIIEIVNYERFQGALLDLNGAHEKPDLGRTRSGPEPPPLRGNPDTHYRSGAHENHDLGRTTQSGAHSGGHEIDDLGRTRSGPEPPPLQGNPDTHYRSGAHENHDLGRTAGTKVKKGRITTEDPSGPSVSTGRPEGPAAADGQRLDIDGLLRIYLSLEGSPDRTTGRDRQAVVDALRRPGVTTWQVAASLYRTAAQRLKSAALDRDVAPKVRSISYYLQELGKGTCMCDGWSDREWAQRQQDLYERLREES